MVVRHAVYERLQGSIVHGKGVDNEDDKEFVIIELPHLHNSRVNILELLTCHGKRDSGGVLNAEGTHV